MAGLQMEGMVKCRHPKFREPLVPVDYRCIHIHRLGCGILVHCTWTCPTCCTCACDSRIPQ